MRDGILHRDCEWSDEVKRVEYRISVALLTEAVWLAEHFRIQHIKLLHEEKWDHEDWVTRKCDRIKRELLLAKKIETKARAVSGKSSNTKSRN